MNKPETGETVDATAKLLAKSTHPAERMDREEILSGLDFEISQRKSEADHQGMNYWGLVVSAVVIFWTGFDLAFTEKHHWVHVLWVFFAAYFSLNQMRVLLGDFQSFRTKQGGASELERHMTFSNALVMGGNRPAKLAYAFFEYSILLAASLPLFWWGYADVGSAVAAVSLFSLGCISILLLVAQVRLPFVDTNSLGDAPFPPLRRALFFVLGAVIACIPIPAIVTASPSISGSDWKQGLLSAGFLILLGWIANRSRESPLLDPLTKIRTDLAFGWTTPEDAKAAVEDLLLGIPPDRVLAGRVRKISQLLNFIRQRSDQVANEMEALIALKSEFDAHADKESFKLQKREEIVHAGRFVFQVTKKIIGMWEQAEKMRQAIDARINTGKILVEFSSLDIKKSMRPAITAKEGAAKSNHRIFTLLTPFWQAYNAMLIGKFESEASIVSMTEKMKKIWELLSAE